MVLAPGRPFPPTCGKGWEEREGITVLVPEKKFLNMLVPSHPNSPTCIPQVCPASTSELCVWLPADVTLQRLAAVLAGYGVELRQLSPEQLSTLLTLLQLLPKGAGRNLGECPGRETSIDQPYGSLLPPWSCPEEKGQGQGREFFCDMRSLAAKGRAEAAEALDQAKVGGRK